MKFKFPIILSILLLSSCQNTSYPFFLEDKYYTLDNQGLFELNHVNEFKELENNKESFAIYIYLPGCLTCSKFKPILEDFLSINHLEFYSISYTKLKSESNTLEKNIEYAPSVALFYEGNLETYLDSTNDDHIEYYESIDGFTNWITNYINIKK